MTAHYCAAPEVQAIARELIRQHHPHLVSVRIEYLFIDKPPRRNGKEVWGTARKVSSLAAFLADQDAEGEPFFVIVISAEVWRYLDARRRRALVDHELCHLWVEEKEDGSPALVLLSHDLEEFAQVVLRHGLWREEISQFHDVTLQALQQQSLYEEPATGGASRAA